MGLKQAMRLLCVTGCLFDLFVYRSRANHSLKRFMSSGRATPISTPQSTGGPFRSKTLTALLACLGGAFGLHRFYLYGKRDLFGWLHLCAALAGLAGLSLLMASQRGSLLGWVLVVPGDISLLAGFLTAIVYGLRPDEKWDAQFNAGTARRSARG